jgi:phospholipid/cholesterol/gamma-HCH transport system ATP-binding protein
MRRFHLIRPPALVRHLPAVPEVPAETQPTEAGPLPQAGPPAIELRGVSKRFDGGPVLSEVSLRVAPGETCVVFGQSGSGKSVLLKVVAGLLKPDAGEVRIFGKDLASLEGTALYQARRKVGVLFQAGALFDSMSVFDNVAFPLRERRELRAPQIASRVRAVLEEVELWDAADRLPAELSGGMVKRVALARALIFDPPVLVLDEPTAGLDPLNTKTVVTLLGRTGRVGAKRAILAVVNDVAAAFAIADSLALLQGGHLLAHAPTQEFRESQDPAVRAFLGAWLARDAIARGARAH